MTPEERVSKLLRDCEGGVIPNETFAKNLALEMRAAVCEELRRFADDLVQNPSLIGEFVAKDGKADEIALAATRFLGVAINAMFAQRARLRAGIIAMGALE